MQQGQTTAAPLSPQRIMQMCFGFAAGDFGGRDQASRIRFACRVAPVAGTARREDANEPARAAAHSRMRCCRWNFFREPMESIRSRPKAEPSWSAPAPRITAVSCAIR